MRFLLHFSLRFRGAGERLGKSAVARVTATSLRARDPGSAPGNRGHCWRPSPSHPPVLTPSGPRFGPAFTPASPAALGLTSALHPPGLGPTARSCLPQPPSRGPQPPPTPPHGPGAMSELEQLRQEAEQLRNQIRVRDWRAAERAGPGGLCVPGQGRHGRGVCVCVVGGSTLISSCLILFMPLSSVLFSLLPIFPASLTGSAISYRMPEKHVGIQH